MSSHHNVANIKSLSRQMILGFTLTSFSALTACAGTSSAKFDGDVATSSRTEPQLDQKSMDPEVTKAHNDETQPELEAISEESDMTVLVLEDRHLLELASQTPSPAGINAEPVGKPEADSFQFGFDAHRLEPEGEAILRQHGRYLEANPEQRVVLTGHADSQGAAAYNRFLSSLRATAAARILKEEGALEGQIQLEAAGSDKPIAQGDHAANRRLELNYKSSQIAIKN